MVRAESREIKPNFVVIDVDGLDTILGSARGGHGFEEWLAEERSAHAQNRLAHPPDVTLVGMDAALMTWAKEMGFQKWKVLVQDNRRNRMYEVTAYIHDRDLDTMSVTCPTDLVKAAPSP